MSADGKTHAGAQVAALLREAIVNGQLLPNERLIELDLAAAYNTNRNSIRDAFSLLEAERLIVREPNRGSRVRLVSAVEGVEIYEARTALEALVARQAALRARPANCKRLEAIIRDAESAYQGGNLSGLSDLNGALHAELRAIADNATLTRLLEGLRTHIVRVQYRTILVPGRAEHSLDEHRQIVGAIRANAPDAAELAMRRHLENVTENLRKAIAQLGATHF